MKNTPTTQPSSVSAAHVAGNNSGLAAAVATGPRPSRLPPSMSVARGNYDSGRTVPGQGGSWHRDDGYDDPMICVRPSQIGPF